MHVSDSVHGQMNTCGACSIYRTQYYAVLYSTALAVLVDTEALSSRDRRRFFPRSLYCIACAHGLPALIHLSEAAQVRL